MISVNRLMSLHKNVLSLIEKSNISRQIQHTLHTKYPFLIINVQIQLRIHIELHHLSLRMRLRFIQYDYVKVSPMIFEYNES